MKYLCEYCQNDFTSVQVPFFCPHCGKSLNLLSTVESQESRPFVEGHYPEENSVQFSTGNYHILKTIGKGGMGEVFLAYDSNCGRRLALKRIREDLFEHPQIHKRFLKEAKITSQLTHPAIIPIYNIYPKDKLPYYTMPFVEGKTLKEILRSARKHEKRGEKHEHLQGSIPSLVRIFLTICQAVAYAHSKQVLHRDLKPENIIIGKYGEVLILDWGLAKVINAPEDADEEMKKQTSPLQHITKFGKIVGTIAYMAPERAQGLPATIQTDIYALGVILYQILTLRHPFHRGKTIQEFKKNLVTEKLYDPIEVAPYRDVPKMLSSMALKCLQPDHSLRYSSVEELIKDLENYIEGRSEWYLVKELQISEKRDWEFQENVLIAEHVAITRGTEVSDWVSLMISKDSFQENTKIEADIWIGERGHGIGFLLCIPEASEREHLNDGYCLWIGSDLNKSTKLLRSTVEVMNAPDVHLQRQKWYHVCIEKIENNIHFYLNNVFQFSYISYLPLSGTHIGLLSRDADFKLDALKVFVGSQSIKVNCLAVPDAFLAHKDFQMALSEYRRIGYSFPGTAEGREALFRAGISLLEEGKATKDKEYQKELFELALEEFGKLHKTPGGPLEYLGKALVYQTLQEYDEEIKCFELAFRRYPQHPLLPILQEQIIHRMLESSRFHRRATYQFCLLVVRHIPGTASSVNAQKLFNNLQKHWETLYFFNTKSAAATQKQRNDEFAIELSFWLAKPYVLLEISEELFTAKERELLVNCFFALTILRATDLAKQLFEKFKTAFSGSAETPFLKAILLASQKQLKEAWESIRSIPINTLSIPFLRFYFFIMEVALSEQQNELVLAIHVHLKQSSLPTQEALRNDSYAIWALLQLNLADRAGELLHSYSFELLHKETSILHFLYGCWLLMTESKEIAFVHLFGVFDIPFPRSWSLVSHNVHGVNDINMMWFTKAFLWEKQQLYQQLSLYYHCLGNNEKSQYYLEKEQNEHWHG